MIEDLIPEYRLRLPLYYFKLNLLKIRTLPTISLPNYWFHLHNLALIVILDSGSAIITSLTVTVLPSLWSDDYYLTSATYATTSNSWFNTFFWYRSPKVIAESSDFTIMLTSDTSLNWDLESNIMVKQDNLSFLLLL